MPSSTARRLVSREVEEEDVGRIVDARHHEVLGVADRNPIPLIQAPTGNLDRRR